MINLIFSIIFVASFAGLLVILVRKLPVLASLPQNESSGLRNSKIVSGIEQKVKDISLAFKKQILLHKLLSWIKRMTLKTEAKIDKLLHNIRKKAQQDNIKK